MRRREFVSVCAGAAFAGAAAPSSLAFPASPAPEADGVPFSLSVMLWTVFNDLPFLQRLEKVHEAGYHAVELVDEFKDWKKQDFADARHKKQELGITFDGTCGVWQPLADPSAREVFLKSLGDFIPTMKELECSRLIMQTGNKIPGLSPAEMHAACIETLKRGADIAAEGFDIVRSVGNPHVKFLYDFFHEQIAAGNLIAKLEKNVDILGLVHVADVPGRHHPGTGEINYPNIFRKLAQIGYSRYVAMEFKPLGDPLKELREARELAISSARSPQSKAGYSLESPFDSLSKSGRHYASA
jgi:hydroxypyruvate isomerase